MKGGAALAILLLIPSIIAFCVQKYWVSRKSYVTVTGKPSSTRIKMDHPANQIHHLRHPPAADGGGLPLIRNDPLRLLCEALGGQPFPDDGQLYPRLHRRLEIHQGYAPLGDRSRRHWQVWWRWSSPILVVRKSFPGKRLMELVSLLTFAVPGTVVGIGYVLAFNEYPPQADRNGRHHHSALHLPRPRRRCPDGNR